MANLLSNEAVEQIRRLIRDENSRYRNLEPKRPRWFKRSGRSTTTTNGGGSGDNCGPCTFQSIGSKTCFDQANSMPGAFEIVAAGSFLNGVEMHHDSDCEYLSDTFEVGCE